MLLATSDHEARVSQLNDDGLTSAVSARSSTAIIEFTSVNAQRERSVLRTSQPSDDVFSPAAAHDVTGDEARANH